MDILEERLESERLCRDLIEHMAEGFAYCRMIFVDGKPTDWIFLAVNYAFVTLTGLEDVPGKRVSEVIPGIRETDPKLFDIYSRVSLTGTPEKFERYVRSLDKWFSFSAFSPVQEHFIAVFDEITERKKHEIEVARLNSELRQRVTELEAIFDTSPIGLAVAEDAQGLHIRGNRALEEMTGLPFGGELSLRAQPPGYRAFHQGKEVPIDALPMQRACRGETVNGQIMDIVREDGTTVTLLSSASPLLDAKGEPCGAVGAFMDITVRKHDVEALQRSHEELEIRVEERTRELKRAIAYNRGLIEASIDPLVTIGYDGKITDVNNATEKVTGVPREELIDRDFSDFFTDPERARAGCQQVFREGSVQDYELEIRHVNGHVTPVIYNATVYRDEEGNVAGVFAAARDITERKLAEEELRDSEERYRRLFETETDAILMIDIETLGLIDANLAAKYMYGYTSEEFRSLHLNNISAEPEKSIETIARNQRIIPHRLHRKKDGTVFPVEISGSYFRNRGREVYVEAIRNISERIRTEEELRNRQNTINSMAMELSLSEERERQRLAEQLHDQIAPKLFLAKMKIHNLFERCQAEESCPTLDDIDSLIDLGVQDIRSLSFQLRPPMLAEMGLVPALRWLCEEFRESYDMLIDFEDDREKKPLKYEMSLAIIQVVRELLLNIVKHAQTKNAHLSIRCENGLIIIKMEDDGIGFDTEDSSLANPRRGGFGSYNARMKIEYLGGELKIDSRPGSGTRVLISAPLGNTMIKKEI